MYQKTQNKTTTRNRMAFIWLRNLGFPIVTVRLAFPKLVGITHGQIARKHGVTRQAITNTVTGHRNHRATQQLIADAWGVPVDIAFDPHDANDNADQPTKKEQTHGPIAH